MMTKFNPCVWLTTVASGRRSRRHADPSYTYLDSEGLLPSSNFGARQGQFTSLLFNTFGQNPNDYVNAEGLLVADRPHTSKVQLVASLSWGFLVGANYLYQTGRAWTRLGRVRGLGFPTAPVIQLEERDGSRRLPAQSVLDLRVQKTFGLGRTMRFVVLCDVLNVFNAGFHEGFLNRIVTSPDFGVPDGFVPPRRGMLGAKLTF